MFFDPTATKYSCVDMTNGMPMLLADVNTSMSEVTLLLKPLAMTAAAAVAAARAGSSKSA